MFGQNPYLSITDNIQTSVLKKSNHNKDCLAVGCYIKCGQEMGFWRIFLKILACTHKRDTRNLPNLHNVVGYRGSQMWL